MAELHPVMSPTVRLIYAMHEAADMRAEERGYLGASVLGEPCERRLWLNFRWAYDPEPFEGRMLRLFETGHREEARIIDELRRIGVEVTDQTEEGGQIAVTFADGHGGGHLDGEVMGLPEAPKAVHVLEIKTHNVKSFAQLKKHGVREAKLMHWAQMQTYMHLRSRDRAVYIAVCKDTDELYLERVHYDAAEAGALMAKAERIVHAHRAPQRIADDAQAFPCRFCPVRQGCHAMPSARRTCRTCLHATPGADGAWWCGRHERALSVTDQRAGCPNHLYLPTLVAGEQVDADLEAETVTYVLPDGGTWVDGGQRGEGRP